ncbi:MAG: germination protein YpeB [Clostridia bacterium]|nr:germination protein YpeB [Clostridia bacterium]
MKKHLSVFLFLFTFAALSALHAYRADDYKQRLTVIYRSAMLSALTEMEGMAGTLEKALLSDTGERNQYLALATEEGAQVQRSLSSLPLSHPDCMKIIKLSNQMNDYAKTLLSQDALTEEDMGQMSRLIDTCLSYTRLLQEKEDLFTAVSARSIPFYPAENTAPVDESICYPTLIYDGPFSDALRQEALPLMGEKEIDWQEAARIARSFIGEERVLQVSHGADMLGPTPCHGVTLQLQDVTLDAAITRQGGKVLWITCRNGAFPGVEGIEACRESARRFLRERGFEGMENTGFQVYEGVAVLSFAPQEGHVLLYPDLIKVQLRMDTAEVVGIETRGYLQNHRARGLLRPRISEAQAREKVHPLLAITDSRLCLIPKGTEEVLCYEFRCSYDQEEYLLYIRADNGAQADLLKIVETAVGPETV